jgi:hypothetical protein
MTGAELRERLRRKTYGDVRSRTLCAAVVSVLGITREVVDDLRATDGFGDLADALTTLLDAAEGK